MLPNAHLTVKVAPVCNLYLQRFWKRITHTNAFLRFSPRLVVGIWLLHRCLLELSLLLSL
jgi:hypothetical protein